MTAHLIAIVGKYSIKWGGGCAAALLCPSYLHRAQREPNVCVVWQAHALLGQ
jgi:hypothetical protein